MYQRPQEGGMQEEDADRGGAHSESSSVPLPAMSPVGSLTSQSSSSRQERVVELLNEPRGNNDNNNLQEVWQIAEGFYNEDVAAVDHSIQDEDWNPDEDGSENFESDESDLGSWVGDLAENYDDAMSEGEEYEDVDMNQSVNYDTTLPISHRYLGEDLEEARGRHYLVEDSIITLPLINLRHLVLLPGQVLPLTTINLNPRIHLYLKSCIVKGISLIGLMSKPNENSFGTTAEIRNYSQQDEELKIILEGRQRFQLLSPPFDATIEGRVKILPEVTLGRPYKLTASRSRFLLNSRNQNKIIVSKHPRWLLQQYEASYLVKKIHKQIRNWCSADLTSDPNEFSYWVAANLSISNEERIELLKSSCTEERLLWILNLLEKSENFGCSACKNVICRREDVFPMSCSGPQNSFVNSVGFVYDTITVRKAKGLIYVSDWSSDYSWFPGYAWRIASCEECRGHIGWCYKTEGDIKPKRFYGLSRLSVRLQPENVQVTAPRNRPHYRVVRAL